MDPFFEIKVKKAFSRVKEDINLIKAEIKEIKALFQSLLNNMSPYEKKESLKIPNKFEVSRENQKEGKESSNGNKGAYSFIHSFIHSPCTSSNNYAHKNEQNEQKNSIQALTSQNYPTQNTQMFNKNDVSHPLQTLTNREFLVFLTIYQLEKELPRVTYQDIASKLSLTSGCIRTYTTSLIRKKAPLIKSKLNNKITILSIEPSFRSLTSEQKLVNLYYQKDPSQSTLL